MKFALLILFTSQFFGIYQLFAIDTYPVTVFDIGMLVFLAVAAKRIIWDGEVLEFPRNFAVFFLFGLIGAVLISAINPIIDGEPARQLQYFKTTFHFLYLIALAVLMSGLKITPDDWKLPMKVILISAVGIHLFGIYQLIARALDLPFAWISMNSVAIAGRGGYDMSSINEGDVRQISLNYGSFYRATSIFSEPSALAGFCTFVLTILMVPYLRNVQHFVQSKRFITIVTVLTIVSLFLTFSLTALSMLLGLVVYGLVSERSKKSIKLIKMIAIMVVIIISTDLIVESMTEISVTSLFTQRVGGILSKYAGGRAETTYGESFFDRLSTITYAMDVWYAYPMTGIGMGGYYYFNTMEAHGFSDSGVFSCLAETGFIGLVMYSGMITSLFVILRSLTTRRRNYSLDDDTTILLHVSIYNVMLLMIASVTANTFVSSQFWLEIALFYSIVAIACRETGQPMLRCKVMHIPLKKLLAPSVSV
ncbi:MAG: O-antigen ligase family protein [Candidatus Kapaibacterium sp.]